jgi:hypothetical protein
VYYLPHQLTGPYDVTLMADVLYPPTGLLLFVPAAVLPWPLWWAPAAILVAVAWGWRPAWWGIAIALILLTWPRAHAAFLYGNTDMWVAAAVAGGLRWGWPAVLITIKPTLAPFALIGIRRRSMWLSVAAMGAFLLLSLPLWLDYISAMSNLRIGSDYSVGSLPLVLVPVVLWAARQRITSGPDSTAPLTGARRPSI